MDAVSIALIDMIFATLFYYYFDKFWPIVEIKISTLMYRIKNKGKISDKKN
jgi:uncharacterized membrane protein